MHSLNHIIFDYVNKKIYRDVQRFLEEHPCKLLPSPDYGYIRISPTTRDGKEINISPDKESRIESVVITKSSKFKSHKFTFSKFSTNYLSIRMGKRNYKICSNPQE